MVIVHNDTKNHSSIGLQFVALLLLVVVAHLLECPFDRIFWLVISCLNVIKSNLSMLLQLLQYFLLQFKRRHCDPLVVFLDIFLFFLLLDFVFILHNIGILVSDLHVRFVESPHYSCGGLFFLHLDHLSWLQMQNFRDFPRHHSRLVVLMASPHPFCSKKATLLLLVFAFNDENIWVIFLVLSFKKELILLYHFGVCLVIGVHRRLN